MSQGSNHPHIVRVAPGIRRHEYSRNRRTYHVRVTRQTPTGGRIDKTATVNTDREARRVKRQLEREIEAELAGTSREQIREQRLLGHIQKLVTEGLLCAICASRVGHHTDASQILEGSMTLSAYAKHWLCIADNDPSISDVTLDGYVNDLNLHILPVLGDRLVTSLRARDVQRWVDDQAARGCAKTTTARRLRLLRRIFKRAVVDGEMIINPAADVQVKVKHSTYSETDPGLLTPYEIATFLLVIDDEWRLHVRMCFLTGLRSGEMLPLAYEDIDFDASVMRVDKSINKNGDIVKTKTHKGDRFVPLDRRTLAFLRQRQIDKRARSGDLIWPKNDMGVPYQGKPISKRLARWKKHAGITKRFSQHGTRRSYIQIVNNAIKDPKQSQALRDTVGHANEKMTEHYSVETLPLRKRQQQFVADRIDEQIERLGALAV